MSEKVLKMKNEVCVVAVVVTYNRKNLLLENINAILGQTHAVQSIVIIDNASTDGTKDLLEHERLLENPRVKYVKLEKNIGGAGGFYEGMKIARDQTNCDAVWIMDDDTIPRPDCLAHLLEGWEKVGLEYSKVSFLASAVYGARGECMNVPEVDARSENNEYSDWYRCLKYGAVKIRNATFVSVLITKDAISDCGLPCKDFFIWGDDTEYTMRLTKFFGPGFFIGQSEAIHKRAISKQLSIDEEVNPVRLKMFRYRVRNQGVICGYYNGTRSYCLYLKSIVARSVVAALKGKFKVSLINIKGAWESLVEYKRFKEFIDCQLHR